MNLALRQRLKEAARAKQVIHYSDLQELLGLEMGNPHDRELVGEYLGEVSRFEAEERRPMLSSVVWRKDDIPGPGFFQLAVELGLANPVDDEDAFDVHELNRTFDYWAEH